MRIVAMVFFAATSAANAATYYCPWADTVVKIEMSEHGETAIVTDAAQSIHQGEPAKVSTVVRMSGGTEFTSLEFAFSADGFDYFFNLQLWARSAKLENHRQRKSDKQVFKNSGWCFTEPSGYSAAFPSTPPTTSNWLSFFVQV